MAGWAKRVEAAATENGSAPVSAAASSPSSGAKWATISAPSSSGLPCPGKINAVNAIFRPVGFVHRSDSTPTEGHG